MLTDRMDIVFIFIFCVSLSVTTSVADGNGEKTEENPATNTTVTVKPGVTATQNSTQNNGNETKSSDSGIDGIIRKFKDNKAMLFRTFCVLMAVTAIVVVYFVIRAWRSRKRRSKSRKYGLITSSGNDLEMEPLDQDVDDDEDMTVFEVNNSRARK